MSDPKYNKYAGTVRFDDDNIVDIDLQPDTKNITVKLNGEEVTGGGGSSNVMVITITVDETTSPFTVSFDKTAAQVNAHLAADDNNIIKFKYVNSGESFYYDVEYSYIEAGTLCLSLISLSAMSITNMVVYPGAVIIDSDSITWDDTLDGNTTGMYPGASYNINYNSGD